jgi:hypothetical protein
MLTAMINCTLIFLIKKTAPLKLLSFPEKKNDKNLENNVKIGHQQEWNKNFEIISTNGNH